MSKASFVWNPFRVYIVGYSFIIGGKRISRIRMSYAKTEEKAIEETKEEIYWSRLDSFRVKVIGNRLYDKKQ